MIRITVREGGTVRTVRLEGARVEMGSGPSAGLRLSGAGISARHCVLRVLRGGLEVLDQASREGTILNGMRVSRAAVRPGDTLTVGSAAVVVEEIVAAPAAFAIPPPGAPLRGAAIPVLVPRAAVPDSALDRDAFELQLYRAVRRSPPILGSLALHAAAAALAILLAPDAPPAPPPRASVVIGTDFSLAQEETILDPDGPQDMPLEAPVPPDPDSLPTTEEERAPLPPSPPRPPDPPDPPEPRSFDAIALDGPRRADAAKPVDFGENPAFHSSGADDANRSAAGLALDSLGGKGSGDRAALKKLDPRRVLVVRGCYDHVEDTLALLGVRHDTLAASEVSIAPLPAGAVLIVDCDSDPWDEKSIRAVQQFVAAGGYLCTTDWGLGHVVEPAFPGMVRSLSRGPTGVSTQNEVVGMRIVAPGHPFARGIRAVTEDAAWWVEDQAHPMEVLDRNRVTVLAESAEFKARYGSGVLAVTFPWGKGKVLHLLGHAWQKEGNLKGTFAIQRMLLNFLIERAATGG